MQYAYERIVTFLPRKMCQRISSDGTDEFSRLPYKSYFALRWSCKWWRGDVDPALMRGTAEITVCVASVVFTISNFHRTDIEKAVHHTPVLGNKITESDPRRRGYAFTISRPRDLG